MNRDDADRVIFALNDAYGRGFLAAFGYQGSELRGSYGVRTRKDTHGVIQQYRYGREEGRICLALADEP